MPQSPAWIREVADGVEITLHIQPGAKKAGVTGEHDGALKLRIAAPPVDGKANAAVTAFIAERCGVARRLVSIVAGELSRHKRVRIEGVGAALVIQRLV